MLAIEAYYKCLTKVNKLVTNNEQDIPAHIFVQIFNEEQLLFFEEQFKLFEINQIKTDEFQKLITYSKLDEGSNSKNYKSFKLPEDYFHYVNSYTLASNKVCNQIELSNKLIEESNIHVYRKDVCYEPSIEWQETLITISGDSIKIWTNNQFNVDSVEIQYLRYPKKINIATGFTDLTNTMTEDINPEFEGYILEKLIDRTALNIAGNINDVNRYNTLSNKIKING